MGANLKYKDEPISFRRRQTHDLTKLLRSLNKESDDVVEILVELTKSQDEKIKLAAASKLVDLQVEVAELINKDGLQRLLLESKNTNAARGLAPEDDDTPQIDFTTIVE